ncbi:TPA: DUF2591 family protein [Proteus mirabilis]|nr:DUF2591 family protein [Proteus mirabilis]
MNKYTELSDFEINKKVAIALGIEGNFWISEKEGDFDKEIPSDERGPIWNTREYAVLSYIPSNGNIFNPCNNPSDAMPIIIENLISLMVDMSEDRESTWWCASDISNGITSRYKSNPLRAAMEVFLMMKDAENEKV